MSARQGITCSGLARSRHGAVGRARPDARASSCERDQASRRSIVRKARVEADRAGGRAPRLHYLGRSARRKRPSRERSLSIRRWRRASHRLDHRNRTGLHPHAAVAWGQERASWRDPPRHRRHRARVRAGMRRVRPGMREFELSASSRANSRRPAPPALLPLDRGRRPQRRGRALCGKRWLDRDRRPDRGGCRGGGRP